MFKKTKVVATIGPASWDPNVLTQMIESGLNVARINMSHADIEEMNRVTKLIRGISTDVAVLVDLCGHEVRLNDFGEPIDLKKGASFTFGCKEGEKPVFVSHKTLFQDIKVGSKILIDDGRIELKVEKIEGEDIVTKVIQGGSLIKKKKLNLPGTHLSFSGLTEKDYEDTVAAVKLGVDYLAASFVRSADEIDLIRDLIQNSQVKIISKIEDPEGVMNFDAILDVSDGIMVARGDLGVEIPAEKVPVLQKKFISKCNKLGKPVIVATQMLESMTESPTPTRAEVNDVANAIFDGTDAVMLSGESSVGKYPAEAVSVMAKVAREVEPNITPEVQDSMPIAKPATNAIARAVYDICNSLPIDKILVASATGTTAIAIARFKPKQPIYAFTRDDVFKRRLALHRGIYPAVLEAAATSRDLGVKAVARDAYEEGLVSETDLVVVVAGANIMGQGATNMLEIQRVGNLL